MGAAPGEPDASLSKLRSFGATFFIFSDYAPAGYSACGTDGAAAFSTSSRTTRWATEKTVQPISRWNS